MPHYNYLIIGSGMTAAAAVEGIREADAAGSVGLIGAEPDPPYNRPPLTKGLWKGKPLESIWRKTEEKKATLHLGRRVEKLDPTNKRVSDDQGTVHTFDKLLLATGGSPRRLPFGGEEILYYRTLADYRRLREGTENGQRFAVIGGGFIGSEIAAALRMNRKEVVMIFPGETIGDGVFPHELGLFLNQFYREKGIVVSAGESVVGLERRGSQLALKSRGKKDSSPHEYLVDGVVAGLGIQPNTDLARAAGLKVNNGIPVDEFLRTSHADIYAAGDVAEFYNPLLNKHLRVEHEDNANTMGALAGRNMAGRSDRYDYLPFFYSDLFDLGYEAVGDLNPRLQTFADWKEPYRQGVIYYLHENRVRGALLWNVWDQVNAARRLIAEPGPIQPENLKGRI
jgi:3-phenylpropionate/trans-cinnamate dioxygenase ferredoxin reductase subunit